MSIFVQIQFQCGRVYISHILPWIWTKSAYFLGFKHFFLKFLKKIAIFCNFCASPYPATSPVYVPWFCPKTLKTPVFERFSWKNCNFLQFLCKTKFMVCERSARPAALVALIPYCGSTCEVPHMSRISAIFWAKSAQNRRNSWISPKNCKKSAIFVQNKNECKPRCKPRLSSSEVHICAIYVPWIWVKSPNFLYFRHFLPKNCKKSAIFVHLFFACKCLIITYLENLKCLIITYLENWHLSQHLIPLHHKIQLFK